MAQHFLLSAKARTLSPKAIYAAGEDKAYETFRKLRWPSTDGEPVCPRCGSVDAYALSTRRQFSCSGCRHRFSVSIRCICYLRPHFRSAALHHVAAWDPYNVTEDADLGMRLARFGYRATVVNSTTYEEAPSTLHRWLPQRTRWFKGWMQTWAVHMRSPFRLYKELGAGGFLTFQLVVGGNVLSALIHPMFLATVIAALSGDRPLLGAEGQPTVLTWLFGMCMTSGYLLSIVLGIRGLARRGLLPHSWVLALVPLHWIILSLAAWRAVYKLMRDPQGWEKTEHGLARSSRRAAAAAASSPDLGAEPVPQLRSAA